MVLSATAAVCLVGAFLVVSWLLPTLVCVRPCLNPPPRAAAVTLLDSSAAGREGSIVAVTPMRFWALFIYWCALHRIPAKLQAPLQVDQGCR